MRCPNWTFIFLSANLKIFVSQLSHEVSVPLNPSQNCSLDCSINYLLLKKASRWSLGLGAALCCLLTLPAQSAASQSGHFIPGDSTLTTVLVTPSDSESQAWAYSFNDPDLFFDTWCAGPGGFGSGNGPSAGLIGTEWKSPNVWIRKTFSAPDSVYSALTLSVFHSGDAEVYLNGVLVAELTGASRTYKEIDISKTALSHMKQGYNAIFIHCQTTNGPHYLDAGLMAFTVVSESPVSLESRNRVHPQWMGKKTFSGRCYNVDGRSSVKPTARLNYLVR